MIAAPVRTQHYTFATVPLRRNYLRQASLFEARTYPLPKVLPGQEVIIVDADCYILNFRRGKVTAYSYFTQLHEIDVESRIDFGFFGYEIMKGRQ